MFSFNQGLSDLQPYGTATSITDVNTTHNPSRAVYIGTGASYDFYMLDTGSWVTFSGLLVGNVYKVRAKGVRVTSGGAAPAAGAILFLN